MMTDKITTFLSYATPNDFTKENLENLSIPSMFLIWNKVTQNIKFDNNNANVLSIDGVRMFEQNDTFDFYVDGSNDDTIETALKYIFKNLLQPIKSKMSEVVVKRITDL